MEEKVELCSVKRSSSYEMPLVIIKEFETKSVFKVYQAYMNDWTPILGENLETRPEAENEIDVIPNEMKNENESNSKCNVFICFLLFFYLGSWKAKYRSLVICKIIRVVDKDKQLTQTSILEAMMMLKNTWGEVTEQTIQNCFRKS